MTTTNDLLIGARYDICLHCEHMASKHVDFWPNPHCLFLGDREMGMEFWGGKRSNCLLHKWDNEAKIIADRKKAMGELGVPSASAPILDDRLISALKLVERQEQIEQLMLSFVERGEMGSDLACDYLREVGIDVDAQTEAQAGGTGGPGG
jgi:hypothetical protein